MMEESKTSNDDEEHGVLIRRALERREGSSERYLTGILDFFKWTTTFAFGLVIWIGSNSQNQNYNKLFLLLSILSIFGSIAVAIYTTNIILDSWNNNRKINYYMHILLTKFPLVENILNYFGRKS